MLDGAIHLIQVGLGALGRMLTAFLVERPQLEISGAVDPDQRLVGRDLGEVAGLGRQLGVRVAKHLEEALADSQADIALLTTVSTLAEARLQVEALLSHKLNIVSSCEELCYPWQTAPEISAAIDRKAKAAGVSVLATGVNPGFLMDALPIGLTALCRKVTRIAVMRYQDASVRRLPFQRKIGVGLTVAQFEEKKAAGAVGHVGLVESVHMIAARMGWRLDCIDETLTPIIANQEVKSEAISVRPGMVAGVQQILSSYVGGEERIRLEFRACLGEENAQDTVVIDGDPQIRFTLPGGVNGDIATCAILTNAIPIVINASPGLRTMADIPPISWFAPPGPLCIWPNRPQR